MKYNNLFSKGRIGNLVLKNRVIMPAMGTNIGGTNGEVTDHQMSLSSVTPLILAQSQMR